MPDQLPTVTGSWPVVSPAIPTPARGLPTPGRRRPAVVAFGGGHGLSASLRALRVVTDRITAVVTVADDGGSSGRLRAEFDVLPPGDLRMALAALCDDTDWGRTWRDVLQHRFVSHGPLDGHALGNLLIVGLWQQLGDPVAGLDWVGRLLGARGRVLPMSDVPLGIEAHVREPDGSLRVVRGQANVAVERGQIETVALVPADPSVPADVAVAVAEADWLVFGPGSWYSSVMPHLTVPRLRQALVASPARRCLTLNVGQDKGESVGMHAVGFLRAWLRAAPDVRLDAVVVDPTEVEDLGEVQRLAGQAGAQVLVRAVRKADGTARHDQLALAAAYRDVFALGG